MSQIMLQINDIDLVCEHIKSIPLNILIFLDIDDVVIVNNKFNKNILKLYDIVGHDRIFYLTARDEIKYKNYTIFQLNKYLKVPIEKIIFAEPLCGKSTKGYYLMQYIKNNNINIENNHIIFIDDLFDNIMDVMSALDILKTFFNLSYMLFHYIKK